MIYRPTLGLLLLLCLWLLSASPLYAAPSYTASSTVAFLSADFPHHSLWAAPRWWEEAVQWVRNLGWDRGRLVQLWLLFMCIGLYVILRIKPRA